MDEIAKLLNKIRKKDRVALEKAIAKIVFCALDGLDIKKLAGHKDLYRVRVGGYRIIYQDFGDRNSIRSIRKRDESTYDDL